MSISKGEVQNDLCGLNEIKRSDLASYLFTVQFKLSNETSESVMKLLSNTKQAEYAHITFRHTFYSFTNRTLGVSVEHI